MAITQIIDSSEAATLTGSINGVNATFTLRYTPQVWGYVATVNDVVKEVSDIDAANKQFTLATAPEIGDKVAFYYLVADYTDDIPAPSYDQISDHVTAVVNMLGGRTDIEARVINWLRDAYLEIGMGYDFEDLEEPLEQSIVGDSSTEAFDYPTSSGQVRAIKSITLLDSDDKPYPLTKKPIGWLDKIQITAGIPAIWSSFKRQIYFRPVPDDTYTAKEKVWLVPPIAATVADTYLRVPQDWLEIIEYAAALRGHTALLERDKAGEILQLLHGSEDPRKGRRVPGLIEQRLIMRQAEARYDNYSMRPKQRAYTR